MKYRLHRGGLVTSMALMVEFEKWSELSAHIRKENSEFEHRIAVNYYSGAKDRIGWPATYIVTMWPTKWNFL